MVTKWAALAAVVGLTACGGNGGSEEANAQTPEQPVERVVTVEVVTVQPETFEDALGITGVVEAERDVVVSAEESGVVRQLLVERGRRVSAGQPIARIDDRVLRAQLDQAQAEAALARETFERQRKLWEEDRIGSEMNYLRARYGAETAEASARVLSTRLERTVVRAPISGVLDERMVEVGTMVAPGASVARIVDIDTLKVSGGVPERYAGEIRQGATAQVVFDQLAGRAFTGRARFVGAAINQQNRTFPIEIAVPNGTGVLKPGMVAKVQLTRGEQRTALMVPREAVLRTESGYIVFVVREQDGRQVAAATAVITGPAAGNRIVIDSGLQAGDRVITVGQNQIATGDVVSVAQPGARP